MILNVENINKSDLEAIKKDIYTYEILEAQELSKILDKYIINWGKGTNYLKMVYLYRLGVMAGKRAERERRKRVNEMDTPGGKQEISSKRKGGK